MELTSLTWLVELAPMALDFAQKRGAPFSSEAFTVEYTNAIRDGQDIMIRLNEAGSEDVKTATKALLITMASVVRAYYKGNSKRASNTNANLMVPYPATDELLRRAKFCRTDRRADSFGCFLVLEQWANEVANLPGAGGLVLPVEGPGGRDKVLLGAPTAYVRNEPVIVDDTLAHDLAWEHNDADIRLDVRRYFERHEISMRSFVSIPVEVPDGARFRPGQGCSDGVMAIVNIHSDKPRLLGRWKGNQQKLLLLMVPLVHMLGYYLARAQQLTEPAGANGRL